MQEIISLWSQSMNETAAGGMNIILLNNLVAMALALYIFSIYRFTHRGISYSKDFNVSLGMITLITALVMNIISNNIALSLGLVGALSIIRFRTAVKDVRDASFIFWSIAVGISCGVSMYRHALIGSLAVTVFFLVMNATKKDGSFLIIIRSDGKSQNMVEQFVDRYFSGRAQLRTRNLSPDYGDLIYEIRQKDYEDAQKTTEGFSFSERLIKMDGVLHTELIEQTESISQ